MTLLLNQSWYSVKRLRTEQNVYAKHRIVNQRLYISRFAYIRQQVLGSVTVLCLSLFTTRCPFSLSPFRLSFLSFLLFPFVHFRTRVRVSWTRRLFTTSCNRWIKRTTVLQRWRVQWRKQEETTGRAQQKTENKVIISNSVIHWTKGIRLREEAQDGTLLKPKRTGQQTMLQNSNKHVAMTTPMAISCNSAKI